MKRPISGWVERSVTHRHFRSRKKWVQPLKMEINKKVEGGSFYNFLISMADPLINYYNFLISRADPLINYRVLAMTRR